MRNRGESGVRESPVRNPAYRLPLAGPLRVGNRPCERIGRPKHGHPLPSPKLGHHVSPRADPALERAPHPRPAGYAPEPASAVLPAGDAAALEAGHLPGHGSPSLPPRAATGSRGSAAGLACARLRVQRERRPFRERLAEVAERLGRALAGGDPAGVPPRVIARRFAASMEPLHVCRGNHALIGGRMQRGNSVACERCEAELPRRGNFRCEGTQFWPQSSRATTEPLLRVVPVSRCQQDRSRTDGDSQNILGPRSLPLGPGRPT